MHTTRVNPSQVDTKRLDPEFYHPDHLATEVILKELKAEALKKVGKFWAGPFGSELPSTLYLSEGVPLFRVSNVGNMQVLYEGMAHLDPKVHERLSASEVHPGDLLIVKASVGEKICRIPDSMPKANITQHIIAIRPNGSADADYIAAFLYCRYGRSQLVRRSLGSIIQYLGVNDARTVLYPPIGRPAQKYVGEKLRQSQRLREYAYHIIRRADSLHDLYIPRQEALPFSRRTQRVSPTRLGDRLDAEHFPPAVHSYIESHPDLTCTLSGLASAIMTGQTRPEVPDGEGIDQATVANLSPSFVRGELRTVLPPNGADRHLCAHDLLLCNAAHTKSYIGKEVTYFDGIGVVVPSTEVTVVRVNRDKVPASFIRRFLLTQVGYLQLQGTVRGITAHSYPKDVAEISVPVPRVSGADRVDWFETDDLVLKAARASRLADLLTRSATFLVEALIDGRLEEADLTEAQSAIELGDGLADRSILMRITQKGIGVLGSPNLFRDFNHLDSELLNCGALSRNP